MNKFSAIIFGIAIVVVIFSAMVWVNMAVPKSELVNDRFVPVPEALQEGQDFTSVIQNLEKHGNVPITVQEGDTGRSNPFAN